MQRKRQDRQWAAEDSRSRAAAPFHPHLARIPPWSILPAVNTRRILLWALGLALLALASGCGVLLVRPTATAPGAETPPLQPTAAATPRPSGGGRATLAAPHPSPTAGLLRVTFSDEPVQFWSNPNDITGLLVTEEAIWAATHGGVVRWNGSGEHTLYTTRDGLAADAVAGIAQDAEGRIWVGHVGTVAWSAFDGARWQAHLDREEAVEAFYQAMLAAEPSDPRMWWRRAGSAWLWLPRGDGRIEAYDGARWRIYGAANGVRSKSWAAAVAPDGQVWAVGEGVSTAQEGDLYWDDHDYFSEIADPQEITGMAADPDGSLWVSYAAPLAGRSGLPGPAESLGGVARYNLALGRWEGFYQELNEALPARVYDLRIGSDGVIWAAGQGAVAVRRPLRPWQGLATGDLTVRCVAPDREGRLWLGTAKGLWSMRADGEDLQGPWLIPSPLLDSEVVALALDADERLVVATARGASTLAPDGQAEVLLEEPILSAAASPQGEVWLGGASGLYRLDAMRGPQREAEETAIALAFDAEGRLWLCAADGALRRLGQEALLNVRERVGELPRNMAFDSQGVLWLSLSQGVGMVTPAGDLSLINGEEALLSPDVRRVVVGADDALWAATARGLARRLPSGRWTRFTVESTGGGLQSGDLRDVRLADDGALWMTTAAGVSRRSAEADWAYLALPGARWVLPGRDIVWVGAQGGLYRLRPEALTAVP